MIVKILSFFGRINISMLFQKYVAMVHDVATGWEASVSRPAK